MHRFIYLSLVIILMATPVFATTVSGLIDTDTTWSLADSPFEIQGTVQVAYDVTLTIEPGVEINAPEYEWGSLEVFGTINAIGTSEDKIAFTQISIFGGNNTSSEPFDLSFQYCYFNNCIICPATGGSAYGTISITDSFMNKMVDYMYLWYPVGHCAIERNVFYKSAGLSIGLSGDNIVDVRNNIFYEYMDNYAIKNWAAYSNSKVVVEGNSFLSTDRIALMLPASYDNAKLSAPNNYWNTADYSVIDSMIYDKNDNLACVDYIEYTPILTEPSAETVALSALWGGNDRRVFAAEVISGQSVSGTTEFATGQDETQDWGENGEDGQDDIYDHWFTFTPQATATHTISLCGSDFDTTLAIFREHNEQWGEEDNWRTYLFNDDFCDYQSQIIHEFEKGQIYHIRIAGFKKQCGNYTLNIDDPLVCVTKPLSDVNNDCKVNLEDFAIFASEWLNCGYNHQDACN